MGINSIAPVRQNSYVAGTNEKWVLRSYQYGVEASGLRTIKNTLYGESEY